MRPWSLGLVLAGAAACGGWGEDPASDRLRVVLDQVASRGPGFEATLRLPSVRGTGEGKTDRGLSAWLQRTPRRLMGDARGMSAQRDDPTAAPWTITSDYGVTHEGSRYLSVVQEITIDRGGVPRSLLVGATFARSSPRPVFLPDLLSEGPGAAEPLQAAADKAGEGGLSVLRRDQTYYLGDETLVLVFEESPSGSLADRRKEVAIPWSALEGAWREGMAPAP